MTTEETIERTNASYLRAAEAHELKLSTDAATATVNLGKAEVEKRTSELILQRMQNANRPSIILGATLDRDGDAYVATYSCVTARGETPEAAFANFDSVWTGRE